MKLCEMFKKFKECFKRDKERKEKGTALWYIFAFIAFGILVIRLYAFCGSDNVDNNLFSVGVLVAIASLFIGGMLGFLFGIPKSNQHKKDGAQPSPETGRVQNGAYDTNTNLEEISDWLTKIIVGVSLTQLSGISSKLFRISDFVAKGMVAPGCDCMLDNYRTVALVIIIYYTTAGFLFGYLWTRLYFGNALNQADRESLENMALKLEGVMQYTEQSDIDANAKNLVNKQLSLGPDEEDLPQDELDKAVESAGRPVKVEIFNSAWKARSDNWNRQGMEHKVEHTIPIFRALINSDKEGVYHRNYAQLGYALKDKKNPDWKAAYDMLTRAIEIRGTVQGQRWHFYEYNRAICMVMLNKVCNTDSSYVAFDKKSIIDDLCVAARSKFVKKLLSKDEMNGTVLGEWMNENQVNIEMDCGKVV